MEQFSNNNPERCPLCDGTDLKEYLRTKDYFLSGEEFTLIKCNQCQLIFTTPFPAENELAGYYKSEQYYSHKTDQKSFTKTIYHFARRINIKSKYRLVNKLIHPGKVLEFGSGSGELLYYFKKKGWNVTGIEPDKTSREFAKHEYDLNIVSENTPETIVNNSFDLVMLWHVLEHVYNLNEKVLEINKLLKNNGLLVLAVPNIESFDARKYGAQWAAIDVPRHLYHFTKHSLTFLLNKHGFSIREILPMKLDAFYVSLLSERYRHSKLSWFSASLNGLRSNLRGSIDKNYSSMIFVAEKIK